VRACSKNRCSQPASATVEIRYGPREVVLFDLPGEHDPNHLELCHEHADRLVPPIGWALHDVRGDGAVELEAAPAGSFLESFRA
jgi:uncharacterized protein DUF3499